MRITHLFLWEKCLVRPKFFMVPRNRPILYLRVSCAECLVSRLEWNFKSVLFYLFYCIFSFTLQPPVILKLATAAKSIRFL